MVIKKQMCDRCGELVHSRSLSIENFNKYDTSSKSAYISSLSKLENVSIEVATSWAEHGLFELCPLKTRNCPECGSELKTWRAKMCLHCGAEFKPWGTNHVST